MYKLLNSDTSMYINPENYILHITEPVKVLSFLKELKFIF